MRIERDLSRLNEPYDVIVIGGGITGVCVAREAAGRGLRTLLVEKGDFGGGTSSATTKYLHGGIRYLETYEFRVVRESLRERRVLGLAAPHLVEQKRFLMPAWKWSKPSTPLIGAGVGLYSVLGYDSNRDAPDSLRVPRPHWLGKSKLLAAVPWLDPSELQGAFAYHDTLNLHPERLLLAFLKSAVAAGATALNHMQAVGFVTEPSSGPNTSAVTVRGVTVEDSLTGDRFDVRGRTVVNAGGPWMDLVLQSLGKPMGVKVNRSKGIHLLTRPIGGKGVVTDTVFARARSGKHVIISPWMDRSFIGPTDTPETATPDDVRVDHTDVELILDTVNSTLAPGVDRLTDADVEATTVGIRPLIVDEGKDSYHTSRRHELYNHGPSGVDHLWSIGGGKWTTGRALGEETVVALLDSPALAGLTPRRFDSTHVAAGGAFAWAEDAEPYLREAVRSRAELGLAPAVREQLARLYGTEHERLLDLVEHDGTLGARISARDGVLDIAAQVVFAVTDEGACTLSDIIDRRLVIGTIGAVSPDEIAAVAAIAAPLLGWDTAATTAAVDAEVARRAAIEALWRVPVG
ncbi:MAG: glpD [Ilumatobacteraceae bacterium]|nr:glpD [Ilumatobacteraceae bacterium]